MNCPSWPSTACPVLGHFHFRMLYDSTCVRIQQRRRARCTISQLGNPPFFVQHRRMIHPCHAMPRGQQRTLFGRRRTGERPSAYYGTNLIQQAGATKDWPTVHRQDRRHRKFGRRSGRLDPPPAGTVRILASTAPSTTLRKNIAKGVAGHAMIVASGSRRVDQERYPVGKPRCKCIIIRTTQASSPSSKGAIRRWATCCVRPAAILFGGGLLAIRPAARRKNDDSIREYDSMKSNDE